MVGGIRVFRSYDRDHDAYTTAQFVRNDHSTRAC